MWFCHWLITFEYSLDPDQAGQNVRPDLDPNCTVYDTLAVIIPDYFFKTFILVTKHVQNYPACTQLITCFCFCCCWIMFQVFGLKIEGQIMDIVSIVHALVIRYQQISVSQAAKKSNFKLILHFSFLKFPPGMLRLIEILLNFVCSNNQSKYIEYLMHSPKDSLNKSLIFNPFNYHKNQLNCGQ